LIESGSWENISINEGDPFVLFWIPSHAYIMIFVSLSGVVGRIKVFITFSVEINVMASLFEMVEWLLLVLLFSGDE
jgi:hypothetical protein